MTAPIIKPFVPPYMKQLDDTIKAQNAKIDALIEQNLELKAKIEAIHFTTQTTQQMILVPNADPLLPPTITPAQG